MGIAEFSKPPATACRHECAAGCAIYDEKPEECTVYKCSWLEGYAGGEDERPDTVGLVAHAMLKHQRPDGRKGLFVFEVEPGTHKTEAAEAWLQARLAEGWVLFLRSTETSPFNQFHVSERLPASEAFVASLRKQGLTVNVHTLASVKQTA